MSRSIWRVVGVLAFLVGLGAFLYLYSGRVDWGDSRAVWNWRCVAGAGLFWGAATIASSYRPVKKDRTV